MLRATVTGKVRSEPRQMSGTTSGRNWSFYVVELLDGDDNKVELTVGDKVPGGQLCKAGVVVEADCDVEVDERRKQLRISARSVRALTDANGQRVAPAAVPAPAAAARAS